MIKVRVFKQSAYPVSSPKIKRILRSFLRKNGIVSDVEVSVALVGEKKMYSLAEKYLKEKRVLHNVLSFPAKENIGEFKYPLSKVVDLGEIVVCFPKARSEAGLEGKLTEEKVVELIEHGALHLLGIHHE